MALYEYRKSPITPKPESEEDLIEIKAPPPKPEDRLTLGKMMSGLKNDMMQLLIESKVAGFIVPFILILIGGNIIFNQVWPDIDQQLRLSAGMYNSDTTALVEGDYIERAQYLSNPGSAYFKNINSQAQDKHILLPDPVSNNFRGRFSLSIPSLSLNNLPVTANVDSNDEASYQAWLNKGLAHFKGTGLPISEVNNNIVIYGHSSSGDYYERTHDVAGAFSRLNKIGVGDTVEIDISGQKFLFRVKSTKIVDPNETDIITGTTDLRTLTLFTCFPNGNSAFRFVAIAYPVTD
jgi:LPXTG-site transpeptidase (sortase) family protein